ncbi:hypothetical protein, partial [Actinobacillus pleuropneumoniae]|uniref:hypothetical protein n=1 Tax=Actinobacillus pleuropneumoniae TaxID=715 RepID=UPI003B01A139
RSNADGSVGFPPVRVGHRQIEFRPRGEGNPVVSDNYGVFAFLQQTIVLFYPQPYSQPYPYLYFHFLLSFFLFASFFSKQLSPP